ncbi:hypothetical protein M5585_27500 [Serratia ureilytica]
MGDVLSLIEDIESKVDREQAEKLANKLKKGDGFDLTDFGAAQADAQHGRHGQHAEQAAGCRPAAGQRQVADGR